MAPYRQQQLTICILKVSMGDYFSEWNGTLGNMEQMLSPHCSVQTAYHWIELDVQVLLLLERIGSEFCEIAWAKAHIWLTLAVSNLS